MGEWVEIAVLVEEDLVEEVAGLFCDLPTGGVVIEDPVVIKQYAARIHPDEWGIPESVRPDGRPLLKAYLPADDQLEQRLSTIRRLLTGLGVETATKLTTKTVREEDWATAWQVYYKPVRIGDRIVVKPSWESFPAAEHDLVIEMDPGMAFGCGDHPTTALCLELMEKYLTPGAAVFDVGAGTGVLAIAAAKLGAGEVIATDNDLIACRVALENVQRNRVGDRVRVSQGNLLEAMVGKQADLIVANIIADVIITLAPQAIRHLAPGGLFIASGIIGERRDSVTAAFKECGFNVLEQAEQGSWVALAGAKK